MNTTIIHSYSTRNVGGSVDRKATRFVVELHARTGGCDVMSVNVSFMLFASGTKLEAEVTMDIL